MGATITGADQIMRRFNHVGNEIKVSPKRLFKIVSEARNRIQKRTNKAMDSNDVGFHALNPAYAEYKKSKGKRGIPDLHFEGHMLNAMQVKGVTNGADIYFNNEKERMKAMYHHYGVAPHKITIKNKKVLSDGMHFFGKSVTVTLPKRPFFKLGDKIEDYIFDEFRKPIKKAIG